MGKDEKIRAASANERKDGERAIKFVKVTQIILRAARTLKAMEFFKEHGLQPFVNLDWGGELDAEDAIEFVSNFNLAREMTLVRDRVIHLTKICLSEVFQLPLGVYVMPRHATVRTYRSSYFDDKKTHPYQFPLDVCTSGVWSARYKFFHHFFLLKRKRTIPHYFVEWLERHAENHDWVGAFQGILYAELQRLQKLLRIQKRTENGPSSRSTVGQHIALILASYESRRLLTIPSQVATPVAKEPSGPTVAVTDKIGAESSASEILCRKLDVVVAESQEEKSRRLCTTAEPPLGKIPICTSGVEPSQPTAEAQSESISPCPKLQEANMEEGFVADRRPPPPGEGSHSKKRRQTPHIDGQQESLSTKCTDTEVLGQKYPLRQGAAIELEPFLKVAQLIRASEGKLSAEHTLEGPKEISQSPICMEREIIKLQYDLAIWNQKYYQQSETLRSTMQGKLDTANQELMISCNELNQQKVRLEEAVSSMQSKLNTANQELVTSSNELSQQKIRLEEAVSSMQSKLDTVNQELVTSHNELSQQKACLEKALSFMQSKLDTANQDLTASRNELSLQKTSLEEAQEELTLQIAKLIKTSEEKVLVERALENEKDVSVCQICMAKPRDTLCLPCSHFLYCFECLSEHQKRTGNKTCPVCRGPISGLLKCVLSM